ncbi:MAG TPA: TonB-dependent receptor [Candidatus Omnitrophota bacterium]|nr:TonB-dependent receptor [Candidatus Omnitrophota bacterium]HPT38741.1 TonB-dependent receptor [Candidatus Omnitrophota bacterium]
MSGIIIKRFFLLFFFLPALALAWEADSQELEPLVITKQEQFLLNSYSTDSLRTNAFNYQSSLENLTNLPIDLQSRALSGGIQTDFSLRGAAFSQVLILLNGQRINDPQTGHYNTEIPFTKEDVKKIEVIPGASSSLFGSDAVGGAVNFILRDPAGQKIVWESAAGSQRNGYGLFSVSDKFKDLGFRVSVEDAQSKGFRPDTDYKKFTASLAADLQLPLGNWENNFGYQQKEYGAYDFYTPGLGYPSREWTSTYLLNSSASLNKEYLLIKPNFLWRRHFDKFALDQRIADYNNHCTDMFVPSIYLQKETGFLGKTGLGIEWAQEKITSTNLGNHDRQRQSLFLDDGLALGKWWDLGFSLRLDDLSEFDRICTGSFSLKLKLNAQAAFNVGISRSMRIPSFTELYYNDPTTLGNPDLTVEKVWNYQAGFELNQEKFSQGLVLFLRQEEQMIDWVRSSASSKWQARNITSDDVFGLEYSLHKKFNQVFSLDANYAYTDKVINNQGYLYKYGPNYARHLANTVFSLNLPFGRQEIGFNYKQRPGRRGWLLLNAGLSYNLSQNSKLLLSATNILNVEYQDIPGIPQPGRYIQAGFRLEW